MAKNKLRRFFTDYDEVVVDETANDANAPANVNYLTDGDLLVSSLPVAKDGIVYQGEAKSDIINSMLRQITTITYGVAQLMANYSDQSGTKTTTNDEAALNKDVTSLTTDADILNMLTHAINILAIDVANARITANTRNNSTATKLVDSQKLVTESTIKNAIKNDVTITEPGWLLDAQMAKTLNDKIDAEIIARGTGDTNAITTAKANTKADLKIKFLGDMVGEYSVPEGESEDGFLYIWKGAQAKYTTFSENNSDNNTGIIDNVVAIID